MNQPDAVRAAYDTVAVDYAALLEDELESKPLDRALLGALVELVRANGNGPIVDVGCGPGRVSAFLDSLGATVSGIDLSPAMVAEARRRHPLLSFREGSMAAIDAADGSLGGLLAWYSIIHTPPAQLPAVFAEFARVLAPGGHALLAFQVGNAPVHLEHAYGHDISLDAYRLDPAALSDLLNEAGLTVFAELVREPEPPEKAPRAYLLARKAAETTRG